jgi:hypothetical protein
MHCRGRASPRLDVNTLTEIPFLLAVDGPPPSSALHSGKHYMQKIEIKKP